MIWSTRWHLRMNIMLRYVPSMTHIKDKYDEKARVKSAATVHSRWARLAASWCRCPAAGSTIVRFLNRLATGSDIHGSWGTWLGPPVLSKVKDNTSLHGRKCQDYGGLNVGYMHQEGYPRPKNFKDRRYQKKYYSQCECIFLEILTATTTFTNDVGLSK